MHETSNLQQLKLLFRKNVQLQRRNPGSTFAQFMMPVLVCFLLMVLGSNDRYNRAGYNAATFELAHGPTHAVKAFPVCDVTRMPECIHSLAVVQNGGALTSDGSDVLDALLAATPLVPPSGVAYFNTSRALNEHLLAHPRSILVGLHFATGFSLHAPDYTVQFNRTAACLIGAFLCDDPEVDVGLAAQVAVERALIEVAARRAQSNPSLVVTLSPRFAEFPHPQFESYQRDMAKIYGPQFLSVGVVFNFIFQLIQLVTEKELGLKLQMRVMGARDGPMWASWLLLFLALNLLLSLELVACLHVFDMAFVTRHDFGLYFCLITLTYVANAAAACFFSAYYHAAASARSLAFTLLLIIMMMINYINDVLYTSLLPAPVVALLSLFPPFLFIHGILDLRDAPGALKWSDRSDNAYDCGSFCEQPYPGCKCRYDATCLPSDPDCVARAPAYIYPLQGIYQQLLLDCVLLLALALWLEQVKVPEGYGRSEPFYFCLTTRYWRGSGAAGAGGAKDLETDEDDRGVEVDADVLEEQQRVLGLVRNDAVAGTLPSRGGAGSTTQVPTTSGGGGADDAIRLVNLKKAFAYTGRKSCWHALKRLVGKATGRGEFVAVSRITFGIRADEIFCLLGHNGAGKTTTFRMLSGVLEPTRGDALVLGKSVRRQLKAVQNAMGLCPQHDVLWAELTAREHLELFGGLAGLPPSQAAESVAKYLRAVDLAHVRDTASCKFSGGMKRRLSVACSLIADPKVLYLDEPTTGMDPVNRRGVWDVIEAAKAGRVVVLTTHAMEEAETLGDRIGIMSRGRLLCLGTSLHLKSRFGSGYHVSVACDEADKPRLTALVQAHVPSAEPASHGVTAKVSFDAASHVIPRLYDEIASTGGGGGGGGASMVVNMCSLEEVFVALAEAANDPEWMRLKYGEQDKARCWERCLGLCRKRRADVTDSTGVGVGVDLGAPLAAAGDETSTRASIVAKTKAELAAQEARLLGTTLSFRASTFRQQFRALYQKNAAYQRKQKSQNRCFNIMTFYMLGFLWISDSLIAIFIGEPYIECAVTSTPKMRIDDAVSLPLLDTSNGAYERFLNKLNGAIHYESDCAHYRSLDEYGQFVDADVDGGGEVNGTSDTELLNRMHFFLGQTCSYRGVDQLDSERYAQLTGKLLPRFGCNVTLFEEVYNAYTYLRDEPTIDDVCKVDGRPNFTFTLPGASSALNLVERSNVACEEAIWLYKASCTNVPATRPAFCPYNDAQAKAINRTATKFGCVADAGNRTAQYDWAQYWRSDGFGYAYPWQPVPAEKLPVFACMAQQMCASGCNATVGRLHELAQPYPLCAAMSTAPLSGAAYAARVASYYATSNGAEQDSDESCRNAAFQMCRVQEAYNVCPGLVPKMKGLPFSSSLPADELAGLGALKYDPAPSVDRSACASSGTCLSEWLDAPPTVSSGTLAGFKLRSGMKDASTREATHRLSSGEGSTQMTCVGGGGGGGGGSCGASRTSLDSHLLGVWRRANWSEAFPEWEPRDPFGESFKEGAYQGAFHFARWATSGASPTFDYTVLYNGTWFPMQIIEEFGFGYFFNRPEVGGLMHRLHAAIYRELSGDSSAELIGATMNFPRAVKVWDALSLMRFLGPIAFVLMTTIMYPIVVGRIVSEKQSRMREIMVMSGLRRAPYWFINWIHALMQYLWQCVLVFAFCYFFPELNRHRVDQAPGFAVFTGNDPLVLVLLFLLHGMALVSFAFFTSTLFNNKTVAMTVPVVFIFVLGPTSWILADNGLNLGTSGDASIMLAGLLPIFAFTNGIMMLAAAVGDPQGRNGQRISLGDLGSPAFSPVGGVLGMLLLDFVLYTLLFLWCDCVLPVGPGLKERPLYFLRRSFWRGDAVAADSDPAACARPPEPGEGADVSAERARVVSAEEQASFQVRCLGLRKQYPRARAPAVVNAQFGIRHRECFGLLGSNGAGKTTTIHILCGLHAPSGGTAVVSEPGAEGGGLDIRTAMGKIQSAMGVCPQDNLLWDDLTGAEHLTFFGRLRGLRRGSELKAQINYWLRRVNLASRADRAKPSRKFSGGMKRRLSVACSLVGNPRLVYLDEPSTGLDPESRRQLWHAISAAKRDKSLILTTHALEEADSLCDRVAIMTHGQLRVIGPPAELRTRFEFGYKLTLSASAEGQAAAHSVVMGLAPEAELVDTISGTRVYQLAKGGVTQVTVGELFETIEAAKAKCGITDWGLSQTSLEEVFLRIVAMEEFGDKRSTQAL